MPEPAVGSVAYSPQIAAALRRVSLGMGWLVAVTGLVVAVGWMADVDILKRGLPSLVTMKFNTAVCFVGLGLGIVSLQRRAGATLALALVAGAVPLLTLAEYAAGTVIGIDNPFGFDTAVAGPTTVPGRMAPATAICFVLGAVALVGHAGRRRWVSLVASLSALVIAMLALMGYAYGVESLYRSLYQSTYSSMALHTAAAFVLANCALLLARPLERPVALLSSTSAGGVMVRRMLPAAVVLPLITGALVVFMLRLRTEVDPPLAFAAFTMAMGASLGLFTWINAARLDGADERRADAERATTLLGRSEERTRRILETAGDAFVGVDRDGLVTAWNHQAEVTFGWSAAEVLGQPVLDLVIPSGDHRSQLDAFSGFLAAGETPEPGRRQELVAVDRHRREFPVELTPWIVETDGVPELNAFIRDVSDRKAAETALQQSNERLHEVAEQAARQRDLASVLLHTMQHGYLFTTDGQIAEINDQLCELLGYGRNELLGRRRPYPFWPTDEVEHLQRVAAALPENDAGDLEVDLVHRNGQRIPVALAIRCVRGADGSVHGLLTTVTDLTEIRRRERSLIDTAGRDPLTGLHNRRSIDEHFAQMQPGDAVIVIDLDHFKAINDTYGHAVGDETLVAFARCLGTTVRDTDWAGRLGGEEFLVVVRDGGASGEGLTHRLRTRWAATNPRTTFSAGIAIHEAGHEPHETLVQADDAMYRAKRNGRDRTETAAGGVQANA